MSYAIIRVEKIKSIQSVRRTLLHAFREQETPNADPALTKNNCNYFSKNFRDAMFRFQSLLPERRIRKDAVLMCEYVVTASPEYFYEKSPSEINAFFYDAAKFLVMKHGSENVVLASIHLDESSPHMHFYVIPKTGDGRLSCKDFFGSPRALNQLQDDFYAHIVKQYPDLQRGIKNTKIKHSPSKFFANAINTEDFMEISDYLDLARGNMRTKEEHESMANKAKETFIKKIRAQEAKIIQLELARKSSDKRLSVVTELEKRVVELESIHVSNTSRDALRGLTEHQHACTMRSPFDRLKRPHTEAETEYKPIQRVDDEFEFTFN